MRKFVFGSVLAASVAAFAMDFGIEMPDGKTVMEKDINPPARYYAIPENCNLKDEESIKKLAEKGKEVFHTVSKGNCVACHCTPDAKGCGNIGPDLSNYRNTLMKAPYIHGEQKDITWLFQKIADTRVFQHGEAGKIPYYNIMTVNLTSKRLTYDEVCQVTAYILNLK